jgi:hypothetical protein
MIGDDLSLLAAKSPSGRRPPMSPLDPCRPIASGSYLGPDSSSASGSLSSRVHESLGEFRHADQPRGMSARVPIDGVSWNEHPRQTTIASITSVVVPQSTCQSPSRSWLTRSTG